MASFTKSEMKKLCDYVGCDSNGKADEMKFNVLLKIHQEGNKAFAALIKNDLKQYQGDEEAFAALIKNDLKQYEADEEESEEESEDQKDDDSGEEKAPKPKNDETKAEAETKHYFIEVDIKGEDNEWFSIEGNQSIDNVKDMIQSKIGIPPEDQRIVFKGKTVYEGTVEQLVADAGEIETVRVKFTCELQGGGKILILSWKSCSINLLFFM